MKKRIKTLSLIAFMMALTACNSDSKKQEETAQPSPSPQAQLPECGIYKGTPTTENMITVHVRCKNGNIPIDEATVTLDGTVKNVKYKGANFSDYIGFRHLEEDTQYKAVLEVVVGGETLKSNVKIRTKSSSTPKWTKNLYDTGIVYSDNDIDTDKIILNLNTVCISEKKSKINFSILNIELSEGGKPYDDIVKLEAGILKVNVLTSYLYGTKGSVTVTINARVNDSSSSSKIKFTYDLTPFERPIK